METIGMEERERAGSPDRFGYEWAHYAQILPESRAQLQRWLGSTPLASFKDKRVLDVGCGMGRNPYWYLQEGASEVVAADIDQGSLTAARQNLGPFKNARVEELSAYDLDPAKLGGSFDRVTCIGVLHHLVDPPAALQRMWSCVKPGGELILWCYAKEGNERLLPIIQTLRFAGSRLPLSVVHAGAKMIALTAWPLIHGLPWKTEYYRNLRTLSFKNVESIIFDQMLPQTAAYWTRKDLDGLRVPLAGATPVIEFVQGNSWHLRVRKAEPQ
jgi:2-polyprenyl-3-methyl-5-hydroxy-6-metoxy-1,4-benzoquinol methylase